MRTITGALTLAMLLSASGAAQADGTVGSFTLVGEGPCQPKLFLDSSETTPPPDNGFQWISADNGVPHLIPLTPDTLTFSGNTAVIENPANFTPELPSVGNTEQIVHAQLNITSNNLSSYPNDNSVKELSCSGSYIWTVAEDIVIELRGQENEGALFCGCFPAAGTGISPRYTDPSY